MTTPVSISSFFTGLDLTTDQQAALTAFESFLREEKARVFILRGYAGTGKTTLIGGLVNYVKALEINCLCMAPTGSAAHVLSRKTGIAAKTVHSTIYRQRNVVFTKDDDIVAHYDLSPHCPKDGSILFVDEASMISESHDTENLHMKFGSGNMLDDLFDFIQYRDNGRTKLIFVGDSAQLPPVKSDFSPALDSAYLGEKYGVVCREAILSQTVRFDNDILNTATRMRQAIENEEYTDYRPFEGDMVQITGNFGLSRAYFDRVQSVEDARDCVALFYGNNNAAKFNEAVRNILVPGELTVTPGERLLVNANNYSANTPLFNGELIDVLEVGDKETRVISFKIDRNREVPFASFVRKVDATTVEVMLCFRELVVRKLDGNEFSIKLLEDLLSYPQNDTPKIMRQALVIDLKMRFKASMRDDFTKPAMHTACFSDPYFNALRAKYAYGMTCHKAQGNEWKTVFVNAWTHPAEYIKTRYRWLYTAYTRATEKLVAECSQDDGDFKDHHVPDTVVKKPFTGSKRSYSEAEATRIALKAFGLSDGDIESALMILESKRKSGGK